MKSPESQRNEFKSAWHDEYFGWIAGFANAKGGTLYVGVNDDGYVIGLKDVRYLLDIIPGRVTSVLGITVGIEHGNDVIGANLKYETVPADVAAKPVNLYARGILTRGAVEDIGEAPEETHCVTEAVQRLFDAAPALVKLLRKDKAYRDKLLADIGNWDRENPIHVNSDGTADYIWITVEPYPYGISYNGRYYTRSGGVSKELQGAELSAFLLKVSGKTWDGMPVQGVQVGELSAEAIQAYRKKAVSSGRRTAAQMAVSDEQVISDLKLYTDMNGQKQLTRAAVLLFHEDPEKYFPGAYIKIAYFAPEGKYGANKSTDIIYHDEVHGPLITQADKAIDILYTKYLKALVSYEGLQRIETYMTPRDAFREVLLNAINHKVYESGNPVQISVYDDRIIVFNQGNWPFEDIDTDRVYEWHSSYPYNPLLSQVFYQAGEIEAYGTGFSKIKIACDSAEAPYPTVTATRNGVKVEILASKHYMNLLRRGRYWDTYPEYSETELTDEEGEVLTDENGIVLTDGEAENGIQDEKSVDRMSDLLSKALTEREKKNIMPIYGYLVHHETIDTATAIKITGKSSSTVNRYLQRLVELTVLDKEGKTKNAVYRRR